MRAVALGWRVYFPTSAFTPLAGTLRSNAAVERPLTAAA